VSAWDIDKALDRFGSVAPLLPGGDALGAIIDFKGIDVELPEPCRLIDSGLFGCCSPAALAALAEFLRRFPTSEAVTAALAERPLTMGDRLLGRARRADSLTALMREDYSETNWAAMRIAVSECVSQGSYLGLGMSP
jgi:hypothetical protein